MIKVSILKQIAANRVNRQVQSEEDLIDLLKVWWSNKFGKPDNHPLFLAKTLEEHVVDYHTDKIMKEGPAQVPTESDEDREKLKAVMGESWHEEYDYLIPPTAEELKGSKTKKEFKQELPVLGSDEPVVVFDEDFSTIGKD